MLRLLPLFSNFGLICQVLPNCSVQAIGGMPTTFLQEVITLMPQSLHRAVIRRKYHS